MSTFTWRKGEHENWYKQIRKFNAKIEKAKKEGYKGELPLKINYREQLNYILNEKDYSRREFNNQMKAIDIFLEKDSLSLVKSKRGAIAPKWELDTIKKVILPDINKGNEEFKKQNEKLSGIKETGKLNPNETRKRKLNFDRKSQNEFEMFIETFNDFNKTTESRNKSTKEGYFKAIENEMGKDEHDINALALKGILENLPDDVITANALYNERTMFFYVYSKDDYDNRFKIIHNEWTRIAKEYNAEQEKKDKERIKVNKKSNKK